MRQMGGSGSRIATESVQLPQKQGHDRSAGMQEGRHGGLGWVGRGESVAGQLGWGHGMVLGCFNKRGGWLESPAEAVAGCRGFRHGPEGPCPGLGSTGTVPWVLES